MLLTSTGGASFSVILADEAATAIPLLELERKRDEQPAVSRGEALAATRFAGFLADYLEENPPPAGSYGAMVSVGSPLPRLSC